MAYRFAGFFARPAAPGPVALAPGAVWRDITEPFVGIGVRLSRLIDEDELPRTAEVQTLARQLGFDSADRWLYLNYVCWGGNIDFVYGLGSRSGVEFGPVEESAQDKVKVAYVGLMAQFGISAEDALRFKPFERGYWGEG